MQENKAAWENPPLPHTDLDSSLRKISGFFNKLRSVTASNYKELEREAAKLRLDKYAIELGESLGIAAAKLSKIVDIEAFVSLVGFLHRFLGPSFTTVAAPKILKYTEATGKLRTNLRITLDLYIDGLILDPLLVTTSLKPVLQLENSTPHATVKLLSGYKGNLVEFLPLLNQYAATLEQSLEPTNAKQNNSLLLFDELQRINEEYRETIENIRAYVELCSIISRPVDPHLNASLESAADSFVEAPKFQPEDASVFHTPKVTPVPSRPATPNSIKWSSCENKLIAMNTPELVCAAAAMFPADPIFYKKAQYLFLNKPRAYSLPFYSLFLSLVPSLAERVVPEVLKRTKEDQMFLRFTSELAKVRLITPDEAVDVLVKLTRPQFQHQHVYVFLEACGPLLLEFQEISSRIADFIDFLKRLPASAPQERQLIDGSISLLIPPSAKPVPQPEYMANLDSFVKLILYRELHEVTLPRAIKVLVKLKATDALRLAPLFVDCVAISRDNIPNVAEIIYSVSKAHLRFGYRVLDIAVEQFMSDLKGDERQSLMSQAIMLGNLQAKGMFGYHLVKLIIESIFEVPRLQFRLKLAVIFILETNPQDVSVPEILEMIEVYKGPMVVDKDFLATYNMAMMHLQCHKAPASKAEDSDEEAEVEDLSDDQTNIDDYDQEEYDGFDQEFDDEEFERGFSEMCGNNKPQLNELPPSRPVAINFAKLKIAKH